ncbi:hypothetical protein [Nocardioides sp. YIM 152588]|uniref:hypothetical protein n=1 Tax=Nocardioides sp. YIM 152588 TaxID=3158259 RepID=UPI0032E3C67D
METRPAPSTDADRPDAWGRRRRLTIGVGLVVVVVAKMCDRALWHVDSLRSRWAEDVIHLAFVAGAAAAWFALTWPYVAARPRLRRNGAIAALVVLIPTTLVSAGLALTALGTSCGYQDGLCFAGPAWALFVGSPALVLGPLVLMAAYGLGNTGSPAGRRLLTLVTTATAGCVVAVIAALSGFWV